eukprot:2654855-Amphidinium_carterae.1
MASVLHAQEQLFNEERLPAAEGEEADDHHVHLWDEDDEPIEEEAEGPVFEFEAPVEVAEAERPKQENPQMFVTDLLAQLVRAYG